MELKIEILSGRRSGQVITLLGFGKTQPDPTTVLEDEALKLSLVVDTYYEYLYLVLHENEVPYTTCTPVAEGWIYEWMPKTLRYGRECFFHNYYGFAELALAKKEHDSEDFLESEVLFEFNFVEVLAKKINAERVDDMLAFLASHSNEALASFFRVTRVRAGFKEGGKSDSFMIEQLEQNLSLLNSVVPIVSLAPIAVLHQENKLVLPNEHTLVDESTLAWCCENVDSLYLANNQHDAIIDLNGDFYASGKVLETHLVKQHDVYENRVLHGFVAVLLISAKSIRQKLGEVPLDVRMQSGISGYMSFFSQIKKFSAAINKAKIERCERIILSLESLMVTLRRRLPVRGVYMGVPHFTQKAKQHDHYRKIFHKMIIWHNFGAPDWSAQEELFSIKNIPKLFEYYLLFLIKDHFDRTEFCNGFALSPLTENSIGDEFEYLWGDLLLRIQYEPKIWTHGHLKSKSQKLINSEGWTPEREKNGRFTGGYRARSTKGFYSNRSPDVVISLSRKDGETAYFIIDAKYTDSKKAFSNYIPDLSLKYLNGIHEKNTGRNLSCGLMIVNPDENAFTRHYHSHEYSIYGKYPVTPAILVSSIEVGSAHVLNSNIRMDLTEAMNLMRNKILLTNDRQVPLLSVVA